MDFGLRGKLMVLKVGWRPKGAASARILLSDMQLGDSSTKASLSEIAEMQ